jgi:hypothetical protein
MHAQSKKIDTHRAALRAAPRAQFSPGRPAPPDQPPQKFSTTAAIPSRPMPKTAPLPRRLISTAPLSREISTSPAEMSLATNYALSYDTPVDHDDEALGFDVDVFEDILNSLNNDEAVADAKASAGAEAAVLNKPKRQKQVSMKQTLGRELLSRDDVANFKKHVSSSNPIAAPADAPPSKKQTSKPKSKSKPPRKTIAKPPPKPMPKRRPRHLPPLPAALPLLHADRLQLVDLNPIPMQHPHTRKSMPQDIRKIKSRPMRIVVFPKELRDKIRRDIVVASSGLKHGAPGRCHALKLIEPSKLEWRHTIDGVEYTMWLEPHYYPGTEKVLHQYKLHVPVYENFKSFKHIGIERKSYVAYLREDQDVLERQPLTRARLWLIEGFSPDIDLHDKDNDEFSPLKFEYQPPNPARHDKRSAQRKQIREEKAAAAAEAAAEAAAAAEAESLRHQMFLGEPCELEPLEALN